MLKKSILALMLIILCGTISAAQKITQQEYEKLKNYCMCKYMEAYLSQFYKDDPGNQNAKLFKDNLQPKLVKYNIGDNISDIKPLIGSYKIKLWQRFVGDYDKKTRKYKENTSDEELIKTLFIKDTKDADIYGNIYKVDLTVTRENLNEKITNYLKQNQPETGITINEDDTETPLIDNSGSWFGSALKWLIIVLVFIIFIFKKQLWKFIKAKIAIFKKKKETMKTYLQEPQNKNIETIEELDYKTKYRELFAENSNLKEISKEISELRTEKKRLEQRVRELEKKLSNTTTEILEPVNRAVTETRTENYLSANVSALYADSIIDDYFNRVSEIQNDDTIFELHLQNERVATFILYTPAYPRVIANPSFLEGCDKQVVSGGQNVHIEQKGEAQRQADGRWCITRKLNVIIK